MVVLTDGQTPWPSAKPSCRTVVGLFGRRGRWSEDSTEYRRREPPDWARVVRIGSAAGEPS
ncbi:hypothetical protein ACW14Y_06575 [Kitasatospora sp. cg17-2]